MAKLNDKDKQYLLSLKPEDITATLLFNLFGDTAKVVDKKVVKVKSKYSFQDTIDLKAGEYFNKTDIITNCGLLIFNKIVVERDLVDVLGYLNNPINKEELGRIDGLMAKALLVDKIDSTVMIKYLNRVQWIGMKLNSLITVSFTPNTFKPLPKVMEAKHKMLKENKDAVEKGDPVALAKMEGKLLEIAKKELEGDPGMMLYDSGARGSFGNNYKNMCVMKGPVLNSNTGKYEVVETSFMEGIEKKDIPTMGTAVVSGAYPKAVGTGVAGYFTKQILAAMQAVVADPNLDDCGSHGVIEIEITNKNMEDLLFRHILDGGKRVLLDDEVIKKYVGKKVKMFSPMACSSTKICRKCLGLMFEKLGIVNIGLTSARVSSTILNLSMKKFHNTTTKIYEIKNTKDLFF